MNYRVHIFVWLSFCFLAVTKMTPRPSIIPDSDAAIAAAAIPEITPPAAPAPTKPEPGKPPSRAGACRVCLKSFKPDDFSRTCSECTQRVCEDCASYSKLDENEDQVIDSIMLCAVQTILVEFFYHQSFFVHHYWC